MRREVMLSPGAVRGWGWVRVSTVASVVVLVVSAATAIVAFSMKLADAQHHRLVVLSVAAAGLAVLGFVAAAAGKFGGLRAARVQHDAQWRAGGPCPLRGDPRR